MNNEEIKIERWSVCERYRNYKSTNYYKEPVQFRPHPQNVVRDVIMYHIYHNEGQMCNDALIQYIKNKIINDLNEIFRLYQYAPDAISTIDRLMSSKRHLGTEETYNEMMFHALTISDARDILIEQITNVLIKCVPVPLVNIKFDVIMKDENMNNNTKESSIEEDIRNDREVRIENRKKEFLNCKSETEKAMLFPRHDFVRLAVADIITDTVKKYQNELGLVFEAQLKGEMKHTTKETVVSSYIFLAMGYISQTFIVNDDVVKQIEKAVEHILNDSLNVPTCERGIDHITCIIWYSSYDTYFKNLLSFPKPVEESSTEQEELKTQSTYSFMKITDKSFETLELAIKLIEGLTSADIMEDDQVNQIVEVSQNLVDKLCEFVNTKNRLFDLGYDRYVEFDGCGFWINNERLDTQHFLDDVVEPIIVEELKRRVLANKSN